jgi:transcriptional regulator with XRE-family HTH domain
VPSDPLPEWVPTRRRAIGLHIARLRAARGLTIDDVAEASGLNRKTVMAIERAINAPTLDTLLLVAAGIGVRLADLVDDAPARADRATPTA